MELWKKGNITTGWRQLKDGSRFDNLFPLNTVKFTDVVHIENGSVDQTVNLMKKVVAAYIGDTKKLAKTLQGSSVRETCRNIWNFAYNHIQYKLDAPYQEQLRTPARSWADRETGIDCDCFSIFVSSILSNLGIPHKFRITKYADSSNPDAWQHVYVVVPDKGTEIIIDCVISKFDFQKPFKANKDYPMSKLNGIDIAVLSGIGEVDSSTYDDLLLQGIDGLGSAEGDDAMKRQLVATLKIARENPDLVTAGGDYAPAFIEKMQYLLDNWDNKATRDAALINLERNEAAYNKQFGLAGNDDDDLNGPDPDEEILGFIEDLQKEIEINGISGVLGRAKKTKKEKKAKRKARRQSFFKKLKTGMKKAGKFFMRFNPVMAPIRGSVLGIIAMSLFGIKKRLKWAFSNEAQRKKNNISDSKYQASKRSWDAIRKMWENIGGKEKALKKAILVGKKGKLDGLDYLDAVMDSDDEPDYYTLYGMMYNHSLGNPAALVAAAVPVLVSLIALLNKHKSADDEPISEDVQNVSEAVQDGANKIAEYKDKDEDNLEGLTGLGSVLEDLADYHELKGTDLGDLGITKTAARKKQLKAKYGKNWKKYWKDEKKSAKTKKKTDKAAKKSAKKKQKADMKLKNDGDFEMPDDNGNSMEVVPETGDDGNNTPNPNSGRNTSNFNRTSKAPVMSNSANRYTGDRYKKPFNIITDLVNPITDTITTLTTGNSSSGGGGGGGTKLLVEDDEQDGTTTVSKQKSAPQSSGGIMDFIKNNPLPVAGGVLAVVGAGYLLLKNKGSKTRSLSGVKSHKRLKSKPKTSNKIAVVNYK